MRISLRELEQEDFEEVCNWLEDPPFKSDFLPFSRDITKNAFRKELEKSLKNDSTIKFYLALHRGFRVGLFLSIKPEKFNYFEVGLYVTPSERGKGYATEAIRLLTKLLFEKFPVLRIEAGTSSLNRPTQRVLKKAGFRREANRRKTLFRNGKWEGSYLYGLIKINRQVLNTDD
jgi:RimJ/RimL family protein N-acetyltransferase